MDNAPNLGSRLLRAFRNILVLGLLVSAATAALYALSLLNSRTYTLDIREGRLVVFKGRLLPLGAEPWTPSDPSLADAYAPIDLKGNTVEGLHRQFGERDELDRALFPVLQMLAVPRVTSQVPREVEEGLGYVRRAERLSGLTQDQRESLKKLKIELAFYLARMRLDESRRQLEEGLAQLKLAAESDSKHRTEANLMLLAVEPQVKLLARTLRATTQEDISSLTKALEPQLQSLFENLKSAATSGASPQ